MKNLTNNVNKVKIISFKIPKSLCWILSINDIEFY